jgi:hypothetical protein
MLRSSPEQTLGVASMKKLLLASVLAIASSTANAQVPPPNETPDPNGCVDHDRRTAIHECDDPNECDPADCPAKPPARVTVAPPYQGPPPIGWVYVPYTQCANPPQCSMGIVNVQADGLNVRTVPNGYPVMSLVNGTPLIPLQKQGDWLLVAPACDLTPTFAWSWTAGVPLNRCWVYF